MSTYFSRPPMGWWPAILAALFVSACGGDDDDNTAASSGGATATTATPAGSSGASGTPGATATTPATAVANVFSTELSGAQEIPPVPGSTATGAGAVIVDPATLVMRAVVTTTGLTGTVAHIHAGAPGVAGPIIFPLTQISPDSGIWTTQTTLTAAQLTTLQSGGYYFNVHTTANPNGEIRGQIVQQLGNNGAATITTPTAGTTGTATASSGGITGNGASFFRSNFVNVLTAAQTVPAATTSGIAVGVATLDRTARTIKTAIVAQGIAGTSAHVHQGAAGAAGAIELTLNQTAATSGIWALSTSLTAAQVTALDIGNLYFDVHTADFPGGVVRAQLLPGSGVGTGTTGTGTTRTGTTGTGTTGIGTTGIGTTGTGITGTGITGIGTTGIGTTGIGTTGIGNTGTGNTGIGMTSLGNSGF